MNKALLTSLIGIAVAAVVTRGFITFITFIENKRYFFNHLDEGEIINFNGEQCVYIEQNWRKETITIRLPSNHVIPIRWTNLDKEEIKRIQNGITVFPKDE